MGDGRQVAQALRHLHVAEAEDEDTDLVASELAFFLVARCESRHAGWRVLRQVLVDAGAGAQVPWEKCARRAVPTTALELTHMAQTAGRTPLPVAQHVAARHRTREVAPFTEPAAVLKELGLTPRAVTPGEWERALVAAITARSREQVARLVAQELDLTAVGTTPSLFAPGDTSA